MRRAQIAVLALALGAGGVAAMLVMRSGEPVAPPPAAPQVATIDILVAKTDIEIGRRLNADQLQWQAWPTTAVSSEDFRQTENPTALKPVAGSITRASFVSGDPILKANMIRRHCHGYLPPVSRPGIPGISPRIWPAAR